MFVHPLGVFSLLGLIFVATIAWSGVGTAGHLHGAKSQTSSTLSWAKP